MTTYADAYAARTHLGMIFFPHPSVVGIGVEKGEGGWYVQVNLKNDTLVGTIPTEVAGAHVTCRVLSETTAFGGQS